VALFKRLRRSAAFLQQLASQLLQQVPQRAQAAPGPAVTASGSSMRPPSKSRARRAVVGVCIIACGYRTWPVTILN
jgi:hypothetical protein